MTRVKMAGALLCVLFALVVSTGAQAQASSDALPITKTLLDGLKVGLNTEIRLRKEFQQLLASYKTPEQYGVCSGEVGMSPEGQKILNLMSTLKDPITPADMQRVMEKMDVEMKALLKQKCGEDVNFVWPIGKRAEKLEEIEAKAAAAVDPSAELPMPNLDGSSVGASEVEMFAAGLSVREYQILKERIVPFCMAYEKGNIKLDGKPVAIPGSGRNIYWVFTAEEAAYIAPRCKELMALLDQLL